MDKTTLRNQPLATVFHSPLPTQDMAPLSRRSFSKVSNAVLQLTGRQLSLHFSVFRRGASEDSFQRVDALTVPGKVIDSFNWISICSLLKSGL
jgi:hypothetical protein